MQKIIFLDIDGPIINRGCYGIDISCSLLRSVMNQSAIGFINILCDKLRAKVVTNSTHSPHIVEGKDLRASLIHHGMKEKYFHENWRTRYPLKLSGVERHREEAINLWQEENGKADWIAFDDSVFTKDPRLIVVDFNEGICYDHFKKALAFFGFDDRLMLY